jgi:hypothetical protein
MPHGDSAILYDKRPNIQKYEMCHSLIGLAHGPLFATILIQKTLSQVFEDSESFALNL